MSCEITENDVNPWNADDYTDINEDPEVQAWQDMMPRKKIAAFTVFTGENLFQDFNQWALENEIGKEDIIEIFVDNHSLKVFYVR